MTGDRLSGLDSSFLHLEQGGAHMHVASTMVFDGPAPPYDEFCDHVRSRLHLVPRFRQKLRFVPFGPGPAGLGRRPALQHRLPRPPHGAPLARLRRAAAKRSPRASSPSGSTARSRSGRSGWSTASRATARRSSRKSHHALVDGVSGSRHHDRAVRCAPDPPEPVEKETGCPSPSPRTRSSSPRRWSSGRPVPAEICAACRALVRRPRQVLAAVEEALGAVGALRRRRLCGPGLPVQRRDRPLPAFRLG